MKMKNPIFKFILMVAVLFILGTSTDAQYDDQSYFLEGMTGILHPDSTIIVSWDAVVIRDAIDLGYKDAFFSLQGAIEIADPGDTVYVCPGSYDPIVIDDRMTGIDIIGDGATLMADDPYETILSILGTSDINIAGFWLYHLTPDTCLAGCIYISQSNDIEITGCDISGSGYYGISVSGSSDIIITDNNIHHCTGYAIDVFCEPWGQNRGCVDIYENYFYENEEDLPSWQDDSIDRKAFMRENYFQDRFGTWD